MMINGLDIILSDAIPKKEILVPIKRHRQKRIQKKYNKKFGFRTKYEHQAVIFDNKIYMSSYAYNKIKEKTSQEGKDV